MKKYIQYMGWRKTSSFLLGFWQASYIFGWMSHKDLTNKKTRLFRKICSVGSDETSIPSGANLILGQSSGRKVDFLTGWWLKGTWGCSNTPSSQDAIVTTRTTTFLVGEYPIHLYLPLLLGGGGRSEWYIIVGSLYIIRKYIGLGKL